MVQINFAQKTVNVKIVYYGPGMSGKTTNLEVVHQRAPDSNRGDLTSISTDGDRTLFFDYLPLELGTVAGMRTCFQLYTVPGQVYYNSTRKLVLQGVDGVIFIADSGSAMLDQNLESLRNLEENLNEYGKSLASLPHVIQWNKRDLPDAMPVDELTKHLNHHGAPSFEGVANTGQGVFPTLKALAAQVLKGIMAESGGVKGGGSGAAGAAPTPAQPGVPTAPSVPTPARSSTGTPASPQPAAKGPRPLSVAASAKTQSATQARPTAATKLMKTETKPGASPKRQAPAKSRQAASGGNARRTRQRQSAATAAPAPTQAKGGMSTGVFIAVAAAIGGVIAWTAMTFLV